MFEKEIKFIVDYTLNKLRKEVAHVNMGRLLNSSIHPAIIRYCTAEIDNQIRTDRNKLLTGSFFDYSGKEISRYFNLITEEIRKNYKMKSDDLKKLIIKAASFNANYVVRPGWTLAKFIFNEEKERTIKDVLNYLNYIYYYQYQIEVLSAFIRKRKIDSLTKEEFMMITGKIDKEVIISNRKEILKDGILSIADFFNEGGMNKDKVSPYLIEYYLKDKKFTEAAGILKKLYSSDDKQKQTVKEIISKLSAELKEDIEIPEQLELPVPVPVNESIPVSEPESESESEPESIPEHISAVEPETADVPETESKISQETIDDKNQEIENYQFTLQNLLEHDDTAETPGIGIHENEPIELPEEEEKPVPESKKESKYHVETRDGIKFIQHSVNALDDFKHREPKSEKTDEKFGLKFVVREEKLLDDSAEDTPEQDSVLHNLDKKHDIFNFLSRKEIERVVESVFNDDQNEFAFTIDKIMECSNYNNASEILKKVFQTYRVNPYSKDAVMLTSAVANFFNQD